MRFSYEDWPVHEASLIHAVSAHPVAKPLSKIMAGCSKCHKPFEAHLLQYQLHQVVWQLVEGICCFRCCILHMCMRGLVVHAARAATHYSKVLSR